MFSCVNTTLRELTANAVRRVTTEMPPRELLTTALLAPVLEHLIVTWTPRDKSLAVTALLDSLDVFVTSQFRLNYKE